MISAFDSNVLVYALVERSEPRGERARELILRATAGSATVLLLQALAEFSYVAMRKYRVKADEVQQRVDALRQSILVEAAVEQDLATALNLVNDQRIASWDALMCATARRLGLQYLLSEDMQDGRRFGSLTIVNPFQARNAALIDRILPP